MVFDPVLIVVCVIIIALVCIPYLLVRYSLREFANMPVKIGSAGYEVAKQLLIAAGIFDVRVEPISGIITDNYNPYDKIIWLSGDVYFGRSILAYGIAAHEVEHAIQNHRGYFLMRFRSLLFPFFNFAQRIGPPLIFTGLALRFSAFQTDLTHIITLIGLALYLAGILFHFITLPVELNAKNKAMEALKKECYISDTESANIEKVLKIAALRRITFAFLALFNVSYWLSEHSRNKSI